MRITKRKMQHKAYDFLLEIGTEEMPAVGLEKYANTFLNTFIENIKNAKLDYADYKFYVSPRRIAILIHKLSSVQKEHFVLKKGPSVNIALDSNNRPTQALIRFAASVNAKIEDLNVEKIGDKGTFYVFKSLEKPRKTIMLLRDIISTTVVKYKNQKTMRYLNGEYQFIRPIKWLVCLYNDKKVNCEIYNIKSSKYTYGHKFMTKTRVLVKSISNYAKTLKKHFVIADFAERKKAILDQFEIIKKKLLTAQIAPDFNIFVYNNELLNEITGLTEWPILMLGNFDESFLKIPSEILISVMHKHQKYIPILKTDRSLSNSFIFVANIKSINPDEVVYGNEKVITARLRDAEFFYKKDLEISFKSRIEILKKMNFYDGLGNLYQKSYRLAAISSELAEKIGVDKTTAYQAGLLAKNDLSTNIVYEFPELQGKIGGIYAKYEGYSDEISSAISEHYEPIDSTANLPTTIFSRILSIADKLDRIIGMLGIGLIPSKDQDPYALKRAVNGIIKIIIFSKPIINIDIVFYVKRMFASFEEQKIKLNDSIGIILNFFKDRIFNFYLKFFPDISQDILESVLSIYANTCNIHVINLHIHILYFLKTNFSLEYNKILEASKRIAKLNCALRINILESDVKFLEILNRINQDLMEFQDEINLYQYMKTKALDFEIIFNASAIYSISFETLAKKDNVFLKKIVEFLSKLSELVANLFVSTMIIVDNQELRENRLKLLLCSKLLFNKLGLLDGIAVS